MGETVAVPLAGKVLPTLLSMLTLVAFVVLHVSVDDPPGLIDVGEAVNVIVGAPEVVVTVTLAFADPPAPVAVPVNVVVEFTATVAEPESANAVWSSPPIPGVITKLVASVVLQVKVTSPPAATDVAFAVNVTVGSVPPLDTVTATVFDTDPPGPLACAVNVVFAETVTFCDPDTGSALELIDGEMDTEVALVDAHVSVTVPPEVTLVESALKISAGAGVSFVGEAFPPQETNSNERVNRIVQRKTCVGRRRDTKFLHKPGREF